MSGVDVIRPLEPAERAHRRAAKVVADQRRLVERMAAFFREVDEVRVELQAAGADWNVILEPPLAAALEAFQDHGAAELGRIEPATLGPLPLMDVEPGR